MQEYFYLLFSSNPANEHVKVYPDGEDKMWYMSHKNFLDLIETTVGYWVIPVFKQALSTHGTYWVFNRINGKLERLFFSTKDLASTKQDIADRVKELTAKDNSPLNPAEAYANAEINTYIIKDNKMQTDVSVIPTQPTIRLH